MDNRDKRNTTILYTSIVVCLFLYLSTYLLNGSEDGDVAAKENNTEVDAGAANGTEETPRPRKRRPIVLQPTTHISHMHTHVLAGVIADIRTRREMCTPEDVHNEEKHRIPKTASRTVKSNEPPEMVVYIAVALLLTSLGAAFVDFYRARTELKSPGAGKKKPGLTRRCSLADLTVLRHTRKESMRKDSVYDGGPSAKVIGRKVSRPPLRLD